MAVVTIGFGPVDHNQPVGQYDAVLAKLPPVFRACCYTENGAKYDLTGPAVVGGCVYATDGRIAVRMPCPADLRAEIVAARGKALFPSSPELVFKGEWQATPLPFDLPVSPPTCDACEGTGKAYAADCRACEGEGFVYSYTGDTFRECKACKGAGYLKSRLPEYPCEACDGTGQYKPGGVDLGSVTLAWCYLRTIRDAGAEIYLSVRKPEGTAVRFVVPGEEIEGVVMPTWRGK